MKKVFFAVLTILFSLNSFAAVVSSPQGFKGVATVERVISQAKKELKGNNVSSRTGSSKMATDVVSSSIIHRLIIVENLNEDDLFSGRVSWLYNRIGKKGIGIIASKKSNKDTRGILQITESTLRYVLKLYKNTGIDDDFAKASHNPVMSAKVAILFVDSALAALSQDERVKLLRNNALLHDYIATAYNGGINYSLGILRKGTEFALCSKVETREYVAKMRLARRLV